MCKASKAIIKHEHKILLLLRDNKPGISSPNKWSLPGGKAENKETYEEALKRELLEEISVVPKKYNYIKEFVEENGRKTAAYVVDLDDTEVTKLKLGDEGQEIRFFRIEELKELKFSRCPMIQYYSKHPEELAKILSLNEL
jgi:8-oxo-dGTP diphosphatase